MSLAIDLVSDATFIVCLAILLYLLLDEIKKRT